MWNTEGGTKVMDEVKKTDLQIVEPLVETLRTVFQETIDGLMCETADDIAASQVLTEWFTEGNKLVMAFDIDGVQIKLVTRKK